VARSGSGGQGGSGGEDDPLSRLAPPAVAAPGERRRPRPLRPALLHGDRDWVIYVECLPDYIVLYPSRRRFPVESLSHSPGHNPFYQAVRQMIARRQATVPPGEAPFRPEVRFLVRPESVRTYHFAYPALDTLPVPKKRQNLQPEDDVSAITAGS
jgi:hypothetical protein